MDMEPPRSGGRPAERRGHVHLRRLSVRAALVRGCPVRPQQPRGRRVAARYGRVVDPHVLAERVQPDSRAIPAHQLRARLRCGRIPVSVPVLHRRARRASVLGVLMKIAIRLAALAPAIVFAATAAFAQGKLNVVATTEDLASIGREVGGDRVSIEAVARGYQDPHFVEAKARLILKLQRADVLVAVGRELEIGWLPPLIQQSRNTKIQPGSQGYLDASLGAAILEIPTGTITRAMGDVHPLGNPHYWMDPENGKRIAKQIADKLSELRPNDRAYFQQQLATFTSRLNEGEKRWLAMMAPYKDTKMVTYHRSFPNFAKR